MYSLTFYKEGVSGNKNTYDDWFLVPTSRPVVNPPEPKTNIIDIPGANGSIDLTESLTGDTVYDNRTGSWDFLVLNDRNPSITWYDLYSDIMDWLHGKHAKIYFNEEPDYYYEGRCSVDGWTSGDRYSSITISYNLKPFKLDKNVTTKTHVQDGSATNYQIINTRMPVVPIFDVDIDEGYTKMWINFKEVTYELSAGINRIPAIVFTEGTNNYRISGHGTVVSSYRGGRL